MLILHGRRRPDRAPGRHASIEALDGRAAQNLQGRPARHVHDAKRRGQCRPAGVHQGVTCRSSLSDERRAKLRCGDRKLSAGAGGHEAVQMTLKMLRELPRPLEVMMLLQIHVILSLNGIASGLFVPYAPQTGRPCDACTASFLATTVLTSITGFPLPPFGVTPGRVVGVISLVLLALALAALYGFRLAGAWRWIYVATAT